MPHYKETENFSLTPTYQKVVPARGDAVSIKLLNTDPANQIELITSANPYSAEFLGAEFFNATSLIFLTPTETNHVFATATKGTVSARFTATSFGGNSNLVSFADTASNEYFRLYVNASGKLAASVRTSSAVQWELVTTNSINVNQEYAVKVTQNGDAPILYVDGVKWAQTFSTSTDTTQWIGDLSVDNGRIGCLNTNGGGNTQFFNGYIHRVRCVAGKMGMLASTTAGLFNFREDSGSSVANSVDNEYSASVVDSFSGNRVILDPGGIIGPGGYETLTGDDVPRAQHIYAACAAGAAVLKVTIAASKSGLED